jgi:hypothetical protein
MNPLVISDSTGAMSANESMRHLWKQFQWRILSRQRISFPWLFLTKHGLCALMTPSVTYGSSFVNDFWVASAWVFGDYFWVNRVCVSWLIYESPVEPVSWIFSDSAENLFHWLFLIQQGLWELPKQRVTFGSGFVDDFLFGSDSVHVDYFVIQQGLCVLTNPGMTCESGFGEDFSIGSDSAFLDYFWVNRGCVRWRIHESPVEAV